MDATEITFDSISDGRYQALLDTVQISTNAIHSIGVFNANTNSQTVAQSPSTNIAEQTDSWLNLGHTMFGTTAKDPSDYDYQPLAIKEFLLCFDSDSLVGFHNSDIAPHLAISIGDHPLEKAIDELAALHKLFGKGELPDDASYCQFDGDTPKYHQHTEKEGSAAKLCKSLAEKPERFLSLLGEHKPIPLCQCTSSQINAAYFQHDGHCAIYLRLRFIPDSVLFIVADSNISGADLTSLATASKNNILRALIGDILAAGINTDTALPETDQDWQQVINELKELDYNELIQRLEIGGFADHPLGEQGNMEDGAMVYRCVECIYFLPHSRWCDLPELPVPVEPNWYCKLWRL
ncbi:MAG: hypothetical protein ACSHWQ_03915 [Spongiibacteraceae bacterium]